MKRGFLGLATLSLLTLGQPLPAFYEFSLFPNNNSYQLNFGPVDSLSYFNTISIYQNNLMLFAPIMGVAMNPQATYAVVLDNGGDVSWISLADIPICSSSFELTGANSTPLPAPLVWHPAGNYVYIADYTNNAVYSSGPNNTNPASVVKITDTISHPSALAVSPDGTLLCVVNNQNYVSIYDISNGQNPFQVSYSPLSVTTGSSGQSTCVAFDVPSGNIIYVTDLQAGVRFFLRGNGQYLGQVEPAAQFSSPTSITVAPYGSNSAYVCNSGKSSVIQFNTKTSRITAEFAVSGVPVNVACSPDGSVIYVTCENGVLDLVNATNLSLIKTLGTYPSQAATQPNPNSATVTGQSRGANRLPGSSFNGN